MPGTELARENSAGEQMSSESISITRPDDWHLHVRDGDLMERVIGFTSSVFARAIVMPNLVPPLTTVKSIRDYRDRIVAVVPAEHQFEPLMTCYLTDSIELTEIRSGFDEGLIKAAKLYPAGATTNSESGVTSISKIHRVLELMQELGMPLLVHGEIVDADTDIFDREALFIEKVMEPTRLRFPELKIVFEHATTAVAIQYVQSTDHATAATITPHHLMINRNALFEGGLRPHVYCLPILKREQDRLALRRAATSGDSRFFLGTDSAPHTVNSKECDAGCAGVFNAPTAMPCIAQVFEEEDALDTLEAFASLNGSSFYGLPENPQKLTLHRVAEIESEEMSTEDVVVGDDSLRIFQPPSRLRWRTGEIA